MSEETLAADPPSRGSLAPCGPECRFARVEADPTSDYLWCTRCGAPRNAGPGAQLCPWFSPRSDRSGDEPAGGRPG